MAVALWVLWAILVAQLVVNLIRDHRARRRADRETARIISFRYRDDEAS